MKVLGKQKCVMMGTFDGTRRHKKPYTGVQRTLDDVRQ